MIRPPSLALTNPKIAVRHVAALVLSAFFRENEDRFERIEGLFGDIEAPNLLRAFREYLMANQRVLSQMVWEILPEPLLEEFGGSDQGRWIEEVAGDESALARAEQEMASDYRSVVEFERQASEQRRHLDAEWARIRALTLCKGEVIGFLSRKAVIPKYGFPVDVVSLDVSMAADDRSIGLDRDLSIAIAEFAPGASVVANKKLWTSYAVKKIRDRQWKQEAYASCRVHGVFYSWLTERPQIEPCCEKFGEGAQYVIPEFGFTTGRVNKPQVPRRRPNRQHSTRPYIVATGESVRTIDVPTSRPVLRIAPASPGDLVVLCEGRLGRGFRICPECGAEVKPTTKRRAGLPHKTPMGVDCSGTAKVVTFGHRFTTDIVRLQFLREVPTGVTSLEGFGWSLGYALLEGAAAVMSAPASDLNVIISYDRSAVVPPIVLYDSVPGGAGLVAGLGEQTRIHASIRAAIERVAGSCGCAEGESCYGCLRSYGNQFVHTVLQRGPVKRYLLDLDRELSN